MDDIIFYQPPLASKSQPPCLPGVITASNAPRGPIACLSGHQAASQLNQQNGISKDQRHKARNVSDESTVYEQDLIATRNFSNSDDDDDFPDLADLWSGKRQKNMPASADLTGGGNENDDDDSFIDIDKLLPSTQQKSVPASADPSSVVMVKLVDNGTRGGSPTDSSSSMVGSSRDPIILSDNDSTSAESETDYSDVDIDVRAKSDSDPPYIADSELADGDAFGSEAALISDRLVTDHQGDDNNHNKGIADKPQLRLSAVRLTPASPDPGSDTLQASNLQVDADIAQRSTDYDELDVAKEVEDEGSNVFAEVDDIDSQSTNGRTSVVSDKNPASESNLCRLQDDQPDNTQFSRRDLAATSPYQSGMKNDYLPKRVRRGSTRNDPGKLPRTRASTRLATTASTPSATPNSADVEPKSHIQITATDGERELCDTDRDMVDDRSSDDSDEEDYASMSDAAVSKRGGRPRSRKRVKRAKDREYNDVEGPPTHLLNGSCQAATAVSSSSTQESEEMPIHGYFTLKTVASKVVYCLTFSQELLPHPQYQGQRQDFTADLDKAQSATSVADPNSQWEIRKIIGQKIVGCERHYRVEWKDTWMPESELDGAKELMDAFMVNDRSGTEVRGRPLKRSRQVTGQLGDGAEEEPKKRRGRPRKYT